MGRGASGPRPRAPAVLAVDLAGRGDRQGAVAHRHLHRAVVRRLQPPRHRERRGLARLEVDEAADARELELPGRLRARVGRPVEAVANDFEKIAVASSQRPSASRHADVGRVDLHRAQRVVADLPNRIRSLGLEPSLTSCGFFVHDIAPVPFTVSDFVPHPATRRRAAARRATHRFIARVASRTSRSRAGRAACPGPRSRRSRCSAGRSPAGQRDDEPGHEGSRRGTLVVLPPGPCCPPSSCRRPRLTENPWASRSSGRCRSARDRPVGLDAHLVADGAVPVGGVLLVAGSLSLRIAAGTPSRSTPCASCRRRGCRSAGRGWRRRSRARADRRLELRADDRRLALSERRARAVVLAVLANTLLLFE